MKEKLTNERGQVGIGTLIVFIALVLVAAIAAGVLINTAGFLQTQAESTGEESTAQVSNNIEVLSASGNVSSSEEVQKVNLTVTRTSGSDDINLSEVSVEWIGDNGFANLVESNFSQDGAADGQFTLSQIKADTDDNVITADADRYQITFDLSASNNGLENMKPGDQATLTLTTQDGASREASLNVPSTLKEKDDVPL
jgi:flagellin-like protein